MAAKITIRNKAGIEIAESYDYTYSGTHMGERSLTVEVQSADPINFSVGDYAELNLTYQSESFYLHAIPVGNRVFDSLMVSYTLIFWWRGYELKNVAFLDYVDGTTSNDAYNQNTGEVYVRGTIVQLMDRIVANMSRVASEGWSGAWSYFINSTESPIVDQSPVKDIVLENQYCWDALSLVNSLFGLEYSISFDSRVIRIGYPPQPVEYPSGTNYVFEFGKDNGICEITRSEAVDKLVTRVFAYGSTRNIPMDYRTGASGHGYSPRLMLPQGTCPNGYMANAAIEAIHGIRESYYINEEIYPTIPTGTNTVSKVDPIYDAPTDGADPIGYKVLFIEARDYHFEVPGGGSYTHHDDAQYITVYPTQEQYNTATVYVESEIDINESDTQSGIDAKMSFNSGYCQGIEFTILSWERELDVNGDFVVPTTWKAKLQRDQNSDNYQMPNATLPIVAGDTFVLLDIYMPDAYVTTAESTLEADTTAWLAKHSGIPLTYSIRIPEEFVEKYLLIQYYLRESNSVDLYDSTLGADATYLIQAITIAWRSDNILPTYDLTISNSPIVGRFQQLELGLKSANIAIGSGSLRSAKKYLEIEKAATVFEKTVTGISGDLKGAIIEPQSIDPASLSVESRADRYLLQAYLQANYNGDINSVLCSDGYLIHKDVDIVWGQVFDTAHQTWTIAAPQSFVLESAKYYWAYIKCNILDGVGVWYLSETKILANEVEGFYMFEWGQIMAVVNGKRIVQNPSGSTGAIQSPIREVPVGVADGVNKIFTLSNTPAFNTDEIYINGQLRYPTLAYELVGNTITFVDAPWVGAYLLAKYFI